MPPGITGVAAAITLREKHPDLQVILCTAYADFTWPDLADRFSGGVILVRKPFEVAEITMIAAALGEKSKLIRENQALKNGR
jgi:CheY-like chemotaxis protein